MTATTDTARRFGWPECPAIAATFIARHSQCTWIRQGPGLLVAHEGTASEAPVAKLALPRLLAGTTCCASLWADSNAAAASPLSARPEAEEQLLRQALAALAALDGGGGGGSTSSSREPLSIGSQLLVLLSADSAALAVYSEGQLLRHKVHTGYTVRRQQGKAQTTYERQGGGARSVGGSIRARETRRLFQAAAATLAGWESDIGGCRLLFRSGPVRVWNELYAARSPPVPVDRRNPRWQPVGISVRRPRLEDVERVYAALSHGTLWEQQQ